MTSQKIEAVKSFQLTPNDTGSTSVQIALLTARIKHLTEHCKSNPKDFSSRRGLLMLVGQRRSFLRYYRKKHTAEQYKVLIDSLDIRK
jgi:small subunit ribosomal protein S15